jgi:hypothetical protein
LLAWHFGVCYLSSVVVGSTQIVTVGQPEELNCVSATQVCDNLRRMPNYLNCEELADSDLPSLLAAQC